MAAAPDLLLLGGCGLERLAAELRARGLAVVTAAWTDTALASELRPRLVYADPFGFELIAPLTVAAARGGPLPAVDATPVRLVREALEGVAERGTPTLFRGLRRPSVGALGLLGGPVSDALAAALDALAAPLAGARILDVAGLWARHGLRLDDADFGMGHGEAADIPAATKLEADWLQAALASLQSGVKVLVVDLDDTLIRGRLTDADFHVKNPAWLPDGEAATRAPEDAWWRLDRGLHEALRIAQSRGIVLALCTRNDPALVAARFRKRPLHARGATDYGFLSRPDHEAAPLYASLVHALALGRDDFVHIEAGFGAKSSALRRIAHTLGVGLDTLAFLDDSTFEREEVRAHAPEVRVVDGPVSGFRDTLLFGPGFFRWEPSAAAEHRTESYRSRATVVSQPPETLEAWLHGLDIEVSFRSALDEELPRVRELLSRTHQLCLTASREPPGPGEAVYVGYCRDRLADHGLVHAAVVHNGWVRAWVVSCRVLPHGVAATFLECLRRAVPGVAVAREATQENGATAGLLDQPPNPWARVVRAAR